MTSRRVATLALAQRVPERDTAPGPSAYVVLDENRHHGARASRAADHPSRRRPYVDDAAMMAPMDTAAPPRPTSTTVAVRARRWARLTVVAAPLPLVAQPAPSPRAPQLPPAESARVAARPDTALVVVGNRVVAVLRAPLGVQTPAERAEAAARRIATLAETLADAPADSAAAVIAAVAARSTPAGLVLEVGGRGVLTLLPADLDTLAGQTTAAAAARSTAALQDVLRAEREERSLAHLLTAAGLAVVATLGFVVCLRLLRGARRWALAHMPVGQGTGDSAPARLPSVAIGGFTLLSADQLVALARRLVDLAAWAAGLFAAYLWLAFVLTRFAYSRPWGEALGAYLRATIGELGLTALSGVPGLFSVVLILVVTRWVARLVGTFFDAVESGSVRQEWVHPETANATKRIAVALLWLFAIVLAYPYVPGSGSDVFKGVSVFAGLVLSLGSSGVMNQAMSGLVLMYSRALKPGDYVRVGEIEGTVTALGMLSTKVRTTKREEVTLPNAVVVGASVKNFSRLSAEGEGVIVHTAVTIGYDVPWRQVEAMLRLAAHRTDGLLADPPAFVLKTGLSDFYVEYQLNAHLAEAHRRIPVLSALHGHVVDVFNEHGVPILSPHYVADPPAPAVVPRERWFAAPARSAGA